jgi:hypothetical protein
MIIKRKGNYVLGLKENQKLLYGDVELFISDKINADQIETFETKEKNGGRIEHRICQRVTDINWLPSKDEWSGLTAVFAVIPFSSKSLSNNNKI